MFKFHEQNIPENRLCSLGGYLWKMKKRNPQQFYVPKWTKRWFSIEGPVLKWYAAQNSVHASGHISLKFITRVSRIMANNGVFSFSVESSNQRTLLLRAESKRILDMWCRAIQMHTDLVKGGDGTSIVTSSAMSLKMRELRNETMEGKLIETENNLKMLESKLNQGDVKCEEAGNLSGNDHMFVKDDEWHSSGSEDSFELCEDKTPEGGDDSCFREKDVFISKCHKKGRDNPMKNDDTVGPRKRGFRMNILRPRCHVKIHV